MNKQAYTILGYTVTNAEQARSVLVVAKLKGAEQAVKQCLAVISKFQPAA